MKSRLLAILTLALTLSTLKIAAQNDEPLAIDLKQVEVNVSMNPSHYNNLLRRFEAADTLMRPDELATTYYGYAYTFEYDPTLNYDEIMELLEKKDYSATLSKATEALAADPLSLELTVASIISATKDPDYNDIDTLMNLQNRFDMLVGTILSTGTGIMPESPFIVIRENDILTLLNSVIGVSEIVDKAMIGDIDAYKIRFGESPREHILYFNNTPQHQYEKLHNQ